MLGDDGYNELLFPLLRVDPDERSSASEMVGCAKRIGIRAPRCGGNTNA